MMLVTNFLTKYFDLVKRYLYQMSLRFVVTGRQSSKINIFFLQLSNNSSNNSSKSSKQNLTSN